MTLAGLPDRYRVIAPLGAGGMGAVHRAHDEILGRDVALKVVHASHALSPEHASRFRREVELLARVDHPHVVAVYDLLPLSQGQVLVLEHLAGESLGSRLQRGPMRASHVLSVARDVAGALTALHATGIVHRDLKPDNVMLCPGRGAVLLDFGLAMTVDGPTMTRITRTGHVVGTLAYLPPEMVDGEDVREPGDLFQFGLLLWEALTGRPALGEPDIAALCRGAPYEALVPPSRQAKGVRDWDDLVMALLRRRPEDRPSASEVLAILEEFGGGGPAAVPRPDADGRPMGDASSGSPVGPVAAAERPEDRTLRKRPVSDGEKSCDKVPMPVAPSAGRGRRLRGIAVTTAVVVAILGAFLFGRSSPRVLDPRLEMGVDHAVVRWRTDRPAPSRLRVLRDDELLLERRRSRRGEDHEIRLRGLEAGTRYVFLVDGEGGEARRLEGATLAPALVGEARAFEQEGVLLVDFRANCNDGLHVEIRRDERWESHPAPGGRGPVRVLLPAAAAATTAWRVRRGETILAEGRGAENGLPLAIPSTEQGLGLRAMTLPKNELALGKDRVYVITSGNLLSAQSLRRSTEGILPSRSMLRQRWAFAPAGLSDGEETGRVGGLAPGPDGRVACLHRRRSGGNRIHVLRDGSRSRRWLERGAPTDGRLPDWVTDVASDWSAPLDGEDVVEIAGDHPLRADREGWWNGTTLHMMVVRLDGPALGHLRHRCGETGRPALDWIGPDELLAAPVVDDSSVGLADRKLVETGRWAIWNETVPDGEDRWFVLEVMVLDEEIHQGRLGVVVHVPRDGPPRAVARFAPRGRCKSLAWDASRRRVFAVADGGVVWADAGGAGFHPWTKEILSSPKATEFRSVCAFAEGRLFLLRRLAESADGGGVGEIGLGGLTQYALAAWDPERDEGESFDPPLPRELSEFLPFPRELRAHDGGIEGITAHGRFRYDLATKRLYAQPGRQAFSMGDWEAEGPWRYTAEGGGGVRVTHVAQPEGRRMRSGK